MAQSIWLGELAILVEFGWHYPTMGWGSQVLRNMEMELKYELNVFVVNDTDNFKQDISIYLVWSGRGGDQR